MMIFVNAFTNVDVRCRSPPLRTLLVLLNPFAPHLTSELWESVASRFPITPPRITDQPWPEYRAEFLVEDEVEIALQVNGKVRDRVTVPIAATNEELEAIALANQRIQEFIAGKAIRKIVVIPKQACQRRRNLRTSPSMFKEFKEFAMKGNVVDLAVAVIIGAAFGKIITSLVEDIIMPSRRQGDRRPRLHQHVSPALRAKCRRAWRLADARKLGAVLAWGNFVTIVINFLIVSFCIFLIVKVLNSMKKPSHDEPATHEGLPCLHDDDSDQRDTLPALHDRVGARVESDAISSILDPSRQVKSRAGRLHPSLPSANRSPAARYPAKLLLATGRSNR